MKRCLAVVIVVVLFAAGSPLFANGAKEKGVGETSAGAPGEPQYGGTLNVLLGNYQSNPPSPDMADGSNQQTQYLFPIQEQPIIGDFETFGPRGTGEYKFQLAGQLPEFTWKGTILESWEVTPEKLIWHVKPGVMWSPNEQQQSWMPTRELVAEDVAYYYRYFRDKTPSGVAFGKWCGKITATDKYTLEFEFKEFNRYWASRIGFEDRSVFGPPEMFERDPKKWENQVGSGPFRLKEYVPSSYMAYTKNPIYHDTAPVNGAEYKYPFVDEMYFYILPDQASRTAALRTGKIDYYRNMPRVAWDEIERAVPEIQYAEWFGRGMILMPQAAEPPMDDVDVRRALMVGTNMTEFQDLYGAGRYPVHFLPYSFALPKTVYTPLEDLPTETRGLYDYSPERARQMLADAGYPNGFETSVYLQADPVYEDVAALLADQWSKIGVEVNLVVMDGAQIQSTMLDHSFEGFLLHSSSIGDVPGQLRLGTGNDAGNFSEWYSQEFDALVDRITTSGDAATVDRLAKEAGLIAANEVLFIPLYPLVARDYYWPWVKNFFGEVTVAEKQMAPVFAEMWIDQAMKSEMGF